jgi:hypothetical protein
MHAKKESLSQETCMRKKLARPEAGERKGRKRRKRRKEREKEKTGGNGDP